MKVLPIFKSHYSLGKSILTLGKPDDKASYPMSILSIAKQNKLKEVTVVDDCLSGLLEAYTNAEKIGVKLVFGLRLDVSSDMTQKDEASLCRRAKYYIMSSGFQGYQDLIKVSSKASTDGFYYTPNIDFKTLKELWTPNLRMLIPFYDSFLFRNTFECGACVPEFDFCSPVFCIEDSDLPFDEILKEKIEKYCGDKYPMMDARSIYYEKEEHFKDYLAVRCINKRSTIEKPNLDHMGSNKFSFETWQNQNK